MKKLLAIFASLAMVASLAACSNGDSEDKGDGDKSESKDSSTTPTTTPVPDVDAEEITAEPLIYLDFEDDSKLTAVYRSNDKGDNNGASYGISETDHGVLFAEKGVVGKALYLDGFYGVDFEMKEVTNDSYTISFWYNADRFYSENWSPSLTVGRNLGKTPSADTTVAWLNFTRVAESMGWGTPNIAPVVWNRNSSIGTDVNADGVFPWISAGDDIEHGKKEWCMVTLVVDGNRYVADDGMERIGTKLYVDGALKFDASAEFMYYQGVAPEILMGDGIEGHLGLNYWDRIFKGFIDELYIYDEPLTAGQVKYLYELGDANAATTAPEHECPLADSGNEADGGDVTPAPELIDITPDASAIDTIGTVERNNGFWTDTSASFEIKDGGKLTIKFNNYSDCVNVFDNPGLVFCNTAVTTDKVASSANFPGYAEYGVARIDGDVNQNGFWGDCTVTFDKTWDNAAYIAVMKAAKGTLTFTREGNVITVDVSIVAMEDNTELTETITFTATNMAAGDPCYVLMVNEKCYTEILSVE